MYEWMEGLLVIQWCQLLSGTEVNAHCWHQSHAVGWIQCTGICTFVVNPVVIGCGFGSHFCSPKISTYIGKFLCEFWFEQVQHTRIILDPANF